MSRRASVERKTSETHVTVAEVVSAQPAPAGLASPHVRVGDQIPIAPPLGVGYVSWADEQTLAEMGIEPPDTLYGLYRGVDLTRRDSGYGNVLPDTIHIYQGPIEEDCADPDEMADLIRDVVIHEVGHYFGLDDETMDGIEQGK